MNTTEFLDPVELDVLWAELRLGELPFPLETPAYGTTIAERDRLRDQARDRLGHRGPRDGERGPVPLLRALGRPTSTVAVLAVAPGMKPVAAVAATDGQVAVLAATTPNGIALRPIRPTALANEVVGWLPPVPAGPGRTANLPIGDARGAALRSVTPDLPIGGGQLRVTHAGPDRRVSVVSWFDTRRGRYLAAHTGPGWLTVTPADRASLRRRVAELLGG